MKIYYLLLAVVLFLTVQGCDPHCCKDCPENPSDSIIEIDSATAHDYIDRFIAVDTTLIIHGVGLPRCGLCNILKKAHTDSIWVNFGMKPDSSYVTVIKYLGSEKYVQVPSLVGMPTCPPSTKCR